MKSKFISNILLTFIWVALTGDFSFENYVFGFFLNFHILWLITYKRNHSKYFVIVPKLILLLVTFLYELIKANLEVAYEVITPKLKMTPGIIMVPLDVKSNIGITLLANMISLTPGTLSIDVSNDRKVLFVHAMYIKDREVFIKSIKNGFEKNFGDNVMTLHDYLYYVILPVLILSAILIFWRLLKGPTIADKVIALDLLITTGIGIIGVYCIIYNHSTLLDSALILGLIAFLSTVALSYYLEKERRNDRNNHRYTGNFWSIIRSFCGDRAGANA